MPGVPSIYYGSEYAVEGKRTRDSDYDLRPCLDLNNVPNANYQLCDHIIKLGKVRLALEALKYGKFENVNIMNEKLVYMRYTDNQTVFVLFNLTDHDERVGFDSRCNAKLTDVLNGNQVFDCNGWCELPVNEYEITGFAKHSESGDRLVIYKSLSDGEVWARPYNMFVETIWDNGRQIKRFEKI